MNFKVNENGTCEKLMPNRIRRCSYVQSNSHMIAAIQNKAKYSMEEWDAQRFCKSYAITNQQSSQLNLGPQLNLNPQEGSGKKKTKRRRRRKKQKTKKKKKRKR